jgi:hypothetical protein
LRNREIGKCPSITRIKIRRGIANIVTTAIILTAVSIMGAMMLVWSQTSMLEQKMEIEEIFNTQLNKINEDLLFENIWFAIPSGVMSDNHLNVTLGNIGILGLNVTTIRVTNVTLGNTTYIDYPFPNFGIDKSVSISRNVTFPWQSGDELDVLVFTGRGNQYITQVVAP